MKRALLIVAACAAMSAPAHAAMTNEQCQAAWVAADLNKDGAPEIITSTKSGTFIFWNNWKNPAPVAR